MSSPKEIYEQFAGGAQWSDIGGHLQRLREAARGNVLEIGVRGGISTAALLLGVKDHGGHVWSLDVGDYGPVFGGDPDWTFIQGHSVRDSDRLLLEVLPPELDMLLIDSDHTYETTRNELYFYALLLRKGGVVFLHDTDLHWAGVRRALDEFAKEMKCVPVYHAGSFGMGELRR